MSLHDMNFDGFVGSENFKYLLFTSLYLLAMYEIHPLNPFSTNKFISMSKIFSSFTPVIFNIASQLNPGELK